MVTNGNVSPVRLESVIGTSEHNTDIVGMVLGRVEIGVISDEDWELHLNIGDIVQN